MILCFDELEMPVFYQIRVGQCILSNILRGHVHGNTKLARDENVPVPRDENQVLFQGILQVRENDNFALSFSIPLRQPYEAVISRNSLADKGGYLRQAKNLISDKASSI